MKKSDEQGGRAYSCMALNYFMRDNAIGPEHEIRVVGCRRLPTFLYKIKSKF